MGVTLSFGEMHYPISFGTGIPLVEYGLRKYGGASLQNGILVPENPHPTVQKLFDWIDDQSPNYIGNQDVMLERLNTDEVAFIYQLMCEFRRCGPVINDQSYDHPLSDLQRRQLNEAIPATKLYLDARLNGSEKKVDY